MLENVAVRNFPDKKERNGENYGKSCKNSGETVPGHERSDAVRGYESEMSAFDESIPEVVKQNVGYCQSRVRGDEKCRKKCRSENSFQNQYREEQKSCVKK